MKFFFLLIIICISYSCSKKLDNSSFQNLEVLKIDEFSNYYRFKSLDEKSNDTLNIISFKNKINYSNCKVTSKISELKKYNFKLQKIRTRVSTMEQLGQWIIISEDTLWSGNSKIIPPTFFLSINTIGREILE